MIRRVSLFGFGALISLLFLAYLSPDNKLKNTFYAYLNYPDADKRIIRQFQLSDKFVYLVSNQAEVDLFLRDCWVNHDLSDKDVYPKKFILDNVISGENQRLHCLLYDNEKIEDRGRVKIFSKTEFVKLEKGISISSKSYNSYYITVGIVLVIMILVIYLIRRNIIKKM